MGEKIPFPQNFARFVELGQQASQQQQWPQAIEHLQAAYALAQTFAVNVLLVTALIADEQYQQAATLAQEKVDDYLAAPTECALYLTVLRQTHNFIGGRKICQAQPVVQAATFWSQELVAIEQAEKSYRQQASQQIATLAKALYQLSAVPIYEQLNLVKQAQHLPLTEFIRASRRLLTDRYVHPLLRANFLDELRQLGVTTAVDYLWLDDTIKAVEPADLGAITAASSLQKLQDQLLTVLAADPVLSQTITGELALQAAYLYPFADQVIVQPKIWAAVYQATYTGKKINLTAFSAAEVAIVQQWQKRFNQLTQRLSE
ncbi:hypothetical protein [Loigolactobacillus jiayinensis]|uniref:TPR repeat-containing protein n=1 Tax=Loigolactobacillus jiayinensis TaxID=2486016 RepID=A0ABW1RGX7_9LACO|nr:hypothetical protein [Loigolactobacillus jiayinensis]